MIEQTYKSVKPAPRATDRSIQRRARTAVRDRRSAILTVIVWTTLLYFLTPLAWLLVSSTKSNSELFSTFGLSFGGHLIENLGNLFVFQDGVFWRWMLNTVVYAGASAVVGTVLATACGYALAKFDFRGKTALFSVIIGSLMIPLTALAIPTYLVFSTVGLTNSPWAIILPSIVSPFGVYLMRVYSSEAVDDSVLEAGRIDGASEFRIFSGIALPALAPGMATVALFILVATWNNYFLPLIMLNSSELFPVTVGLAQWEAAAGVATSSQTLYSLVLTGSFVSILPLIGSFLFLQRFWQSGLTAGSVKG
ncbi:carbohydrate ABC transporter permease [Diaminobutyricibacter sp. McL0608]|uniref:carbohydrate ABC transporter permease n=1 Tax=Leifsonia sp. McL0608 TaxID=3143537 RepID=UPI0031F2F5B1